MSFAQRSVRSTPFNARARNEANRAAPIVTEQVSETDPSGGGTTTYTYDADGELTTVKDPDNNVTSYTYDSAGNTATETSPTGGITTYTYDLDGDLTQSVDPDGHEIQYAYDADGRETTETWVNPLGGSPLNLITMTYDAAGDMTKIQDASSEYTYTYDNDGNVTSVSDAGTTGLPSVTLTYEYDGDGNRTAMDDSLGGLTSYAYDRDDDLIAEAQSGTGVASKLVEFAYDTAGDLTTLTRYSDVAGTDEVAQTAYTYDNAEQLTGITDKNAGGTTLASYSYTLDAAGRLTSETQTWGYSSDTSSYTYTNNNQLTAVTHTDSSLPNESFSYDANGNRTMTGYSTGTGNELLSDGTYDYTYDADGNMITQTDIATGVEDVYTYDFRNRLTEVQQVSGGVTTTLATYTYDALDRRIGVSEGGTTTWTLYDGDAPVLDFNGSGTQTARYMNGLNGLAVDTLLARETPSGGTAWYLQDRLSSVGDIIDNSGTVLDHIAYSAFGNVVSESDPSEGDRFKFAGLQYDPVTGQNFADHRVEIPAVGRWMSPDPKGFTAGDADLYRYAGNDPASEVDPTGLNAVQRFWVDYKRYLWNPGDMDPGWGTAERIAVGTAGVSLTAAGGLALIGLNPVLWGGAAAAAGGASLGVGTTAVVGPGLGAGTYPALLIDGVVYVHRFHVLAAELAGGASACGTVQKYGMAIIDATGKVIGWL